MSKNRIHPLLTTILALVSVLGVAAGFASGPGAEASSAPNWPQIHLVERYSGLEEPINITHAGDGTGRIFVSEHCGRVRVIKNGAVLARPFLDITDRVTCYWERGLLGLAFPPNFASKGYFYVHYTGVGSNTVVARFHVNATNPDIADPASEQIVLYALQPGISHKGGQLAFGPDGYLYIGLGDGNYTDPANQNFRAQDPASLLGKVLRIDVESAAQPNVEPAAVSTVRTSTHSLFLPGIGVQGEPRYLIPSSNPFVNRPGYRGEIWAMGLRNPWRFSFDRATGDLYIGDVGQSVVEEIDFQPHSSRGGENYGWPIMEGTRCYLSAGCNTQGLSLPAIEYTHDGRHCAVIGGATYRGPGNAGLHGLYFYGDYCTANIWAARQQGGVWQSQMLYNAPFRTSSFGEDEAGNLYVTDFSGGIVYQIVEATEQG